MNETHYQSLNAWFNSFVTTGYLCFILYDHSISFKKWFDKLIEKLKERPKVLTKSLLHRRALDDIYEALNNGFSY